MLYLKLDLPSWRIRHLLNETAAIAAVRGGWDRLGLAGVASRISDQELIERVIDGVDRGSLVALFLPYASDPHDRLGVGVPSPHGAALSGSPPSQPISAWSRVERIKASLARVPSHLKGPLRAAIEDLLSPASIAVTAAAFAALAVSHAYGVGELVDAGLALIAYSLAGLAGLRALTDLVGATIDAAGATTEAELDAASLRYAGAFTTLGVAFLTILVTRAARRAGRSRMAGRENAPEPDEAQTSTSGRERSAGAGDILAQRKSVASQYYQRTGWSQDRIDDQLKGIDFNQDVSVTTLHEGDVVTQWVRPGRGVGNYFAPEGTSPDQLGISGEGRVLQSFQVTKDTEVLQSTAAPITDTWSGPGSVATQGGGTQWFAADKTAFQPLGGSP